ncbi:pyruvate dehydrogenase (acetyl-transferring) E1 component subunit alpha [Patescibacteria group bacterium AH-259-L05]|nr:pyruvate dehydrogenase (acetyl-transferring) E1 component subunit alpha [Patescibacteria group bacterium AH-259-L05]
MEMVQFLNQEGRASKDIPKISSDVIKRMYELMVLARTFDDIALKLQREGRILTYASLLGQEAAQIGSALAFSKSDWLVPYYRDNGVFITAGYPLDLLYLYWTGDVRGMKIPHDINILPISVPVGSQIPHATGISWAHALQGKKLATGVYFGDGATSKGDFHVGLNFAGVLNTPCIFICENNQWAISVPRSRQTKSETIAQKAQAYGIEGVLVDGNDVIAVYSTVMQAIEKAKKGGGPTLIECYTYRMESHTTADEWKRYRSGKEVDEWKAKDPIKRLEKYMETLDLWDNAYAEKVIESAQTQVNEAVKKFESYPPPQPHEMFEHIYEKRPPELEEQWTSAFGR